MIKLDLPDKPEKLTDELQAELTQQFKDEGKDVWNKSFIRKAVGEMAFSKCCYSECKIQEESKYLEVEHFYPKEKYKDKVVEWGNLLPSCKKCNTTKGDLDPAECPIVNPFVDKPNEHLFLQKYRFRSRTEKGKNTIAVVALNDRDHFVNKRYKIGNQISERLEYLHEQIEDSQDRLLSNPKVQRSFLTRFLNLLRQGSKQEEFAATVATEIMESEDFECICSFLESNSLLNDEIADVIDELKSISLTK